VHHGIERQLFKSLEMVEQALSIKRPFFMPVARTYRSSMSLVATETTAEICVSFSILHSRMHPARSQR
jgi:hypothetical protein